MKTKILVLNCVLCLFAAKVAYGQTPNSLINTASSREVEKERGLDEEKEVGEDRDLGDKGLSANNFWLGAQIGYKFGGTEEFADNLLVSGRLLYNIDLGLEKFQLPVMGNISTLRSTLSDQGNQNTDTINSMVNDLLISTQGINAGLYPYYSLINEDYYSIVVHGTATWKLNSFKNRQEEYEYINQGRFSAGIEASIGGRTNGRYPLVVSVTPTLTVFDPDKYESIFGERKNSLSSLEITGVLPIGNGAGLLFESIISDESDAAFRVGIIIAALTDDE